MAEGEWNWICVILKTCYFLNRVNCRKCYFLSSIIVGNVPFCPTENLEKILLKSIRKWPKTIFRLERFTNFESLYVNINGYFSHLTVLHLAVKKQSCYEHILLNDICVCVCVWKMCACLGNTSKTREYWHFLVC